MTIPVSAEHLVAPDRAAWRDEALGSGIIIGFRRVECSRAGDDAHLPAT